jgi:predicted flap endonuclease-1-like 5' DNA nuclease
MTDQSGAEAGSDAEESLTNLKFIGPASADTMADADFDAPQVRDKRVSYRMLVEAGTNPGVATKIRREHSLPWSITGEGGDLDKRSEQVSGLSDDEADWVAASSGDWSTEDAGTDDAAAETAEADGSGDSADAEAAWRDRSKPTSVTEMDGVSEEAAERLSSIGVTSIRSLATITPEHVADLLDLDEETVREWRDDADDRV